MDKLSRIGLLEWETFVSLVLATQEYIMPCFKPLQAYRSRQMTKSGKRATTFDPLQSYGLESCKLTLPCGQCIGCRLEYARQWAMRCMHEASLHDRNSFITLTFNNENLPKDGSLDVRVFQLFMKKLRKYFASDEFVQMFPSYAKKSGIRFYHCGEYGDKNLRPHYHSLLFGCDFPDKYEFYPKGCKPVNGIKYYRSEILEKLWPYGYCIIGDVTFESASYVARYCMKKITGKNSSSHYLTDQVDIDTGEIFQRKPEYSTMSRRSAIGKDWYDSFKGDVYPHDFTYLRDRKMRPPKYYDRMYEVDFPDEFAAIKLKRKRDSIKRELADCGSSDPYCKSVRLDTKERHTELVTQKLVRRVDSES